jgi:hypothetical protein
MNEGGAHELLIPFSAVWEKIKKIREDIMCLVAMYPTGKTVLLFRNGKNGYEGREEKSVPSRKGQAAGGSVRCRGEGQPSGYLT